MTDINRDNINPEIPPDTNPQQINPEPTVTNSTTNTAPDAATASAEPATPSAAPSTTNAETTTPTTAPSDPSSRKPTPELVLETSEILESEERAKEAAAKVAETAAKANASKTNNPRPTEPPPAPSYQPPVYGQGIPPQQPQSVQYAQQPSAYYPPPGYHQKSRIAAALLAIIFGSFGIHNYYLGFNARATVQLIISLTTCGIGIIPMAIWGFVEGILIFIGDNNRIYDAKGVLLRD